MITRTALRGFAAATLLVVLTSSAANAQMTESRFGVKAGIALPMGDFGDAAELGFHLGGHLSLPIQGALALRFDADYGRYAGADL